MENGNSNKQLNKKETQEKKYLDYTEEQLLEIMEKLISMYDTAKAFTPLNNKTK